MASPSNLTLDVILRGRRQVTLPAQVCERMGLQTGDRLEMRVEDDTLVVKPKKGLALRALREIQAAFAASGIREEELQQSGQEIRDQIYRERHVRKMPRLS
jgi:AbrB family looped-hinge helix DNA binding protein